MPLQGPVQKFKVVISYQTEEGVDYDPIWADDRHQAEEIALAMFKERRADFDRLKGVKACAMNTAK